jgi:hypothetical protein
LGAKGAGTAAGALAAAGTALGGWQIAAVLVLPFTAVLLLVAWVLADPERSCRLEALIKACRLRADTAAAEAMAQAPARPRRRRSAAAAPAVSPTDTLAVVPPPPEHGGS